MTPEERARAGAAIAERMTELGLTVRTLADKADVSQPTVRYLLRGERWPYQETRAKLNDALDWPPGEIQRRALVSLENFTIVELLTEVLKRVQSIGELEKV